MLAICACACTERSRCIYDFKKKRDKLHTKSDNTIHWYYYYYYYYYQWAVIFVSTCLLNTLYMAIILWWPTGQWHMTGLRLVFITK